MKPREEKVSKYFQSHCKWERPDGLDKAFWEWSTGREASGRGTCQHKGVWEYEAKLPENATQKNHGWQQFVLRFVSLRTCAVGLQFYFWVHRDKKLVFLQKQQNQICIVSAPAMFPQHCYKTPLRVSAVMREKKLILQDRRYGWSSHICHCSSPTDWISIKSLDMKKKKHLAFESRGTAWMIEVHSRYSQDTVWCSAPIGSCWRSLPGWCIS